MKFRNSHITLKFDLHFLQRNHGECYTVCQKDSSKNSIHRKEIKHPYTLGCEELLGN